GEPPPPRRDGGEGGRGTFRQDGRGGWGKSGGFRGFMAPATAVPDLVRIAQGPRYDSGLRIAAARLLGRTGLAMEVAVPVLLELVLSNWKVAEYAEAVLCGTLDQQFGYVGEPGINGWGRIGLPFLLESLQDPDLNVRSRTIKLLGRLGPEALEAVPALKEATEDPQVRTRVEEALLRISSPNTAEKIIEEKRTRTRRKLR